MDAATFLTLARDYVRSDGVDDDVLQQNVNSAVGIAAGFCRRVLYWDAATMQTAQANYQAALTNAENAWQAAMDAYMPPCWEDGIDRYFSNWHPPTAQDRINMGLLETAYKTYSKTLSDLGKINDGIVIDDSIIAALLLITGHAYSNRQEVISTAGAVAIQLPLGAQKILEPYMAV